MFLHLALSPSNEIAIISALRIYYLIGAEPRHRLCGTR